MNFIRLILIFALVPSLLFQSCTNYSIIKNNGNLSLDEDLNEKDIRINLKNGEIIESKRDHHIVVAQSPDSTGIYCIEYNTKSENKFDRFISLDKIKILETFSGSKTITMLIFGSIIVTVLLLFLIAKPPIGAT
ncbi:MAG TPA: hypothetical protein VKA26_01530 [Ignavibacteriaceae bacterium]|nr:hypothetical protein [Ignavibacteriaceae bacterium]